MSNNEEYNGWTNRETWAVMLYIGNDEAWDEQVRALAREAVEQTDEDYYHRRFAVEDALQEWVETMFTRDGYESMTGMRMPDAIGLMAEDIGSLWRIDYVQCAEHLLEDMDIHPE